MEVFGWFSAHYKDMGMVVMYIWFALEVIVRLTPTQKDDGFLERAGFYMRKFFDLLKLPNNKK